MKKILILTLACITLLTGCFNKDSMEDIKVYVTYYPIEFITTTLYGSHADIASIYPDDINIYNFELTKKQIKDYSKGDLFIYDGQSKQRSYAVKMLDSNKSIKIIDASKGVIYDDNIESLWLNPGNMLMISQNIKKGFEEYITNPYLTKEVEENYNKLKIKISELDVELKTITNNSNNRTIVVSNDVFNFLDKYNFNVISLEENDNLSTKKIDDVKTLINNNTIKYIYLIEGEEKSETIKKIIDETNVETLTLNTMSSISSKERQEEKDYLSIMADNIQALKKGFN